VNHSRNVTASKVVAWGAITGGILLAGGCSEIFGFERSNLLAQCVHNSDCATGLECVDSLCTHACVLSSDCSGNPGDFPYLVCKDGRCVGTQDAGVAVGPVDDASSGNETGSDAPQGCGDITTDVNNCGRCGHVCTGNNATWTCAFSECVPQCNPGWGDCDGDPSNGCEQDIAGNALSCGSCGKPDSSTSMCGSDVCENGVCAIGDLVGGACTESQDPLGSLNTFYANMIVGVRFWSGAGGRVTAIGITTASGAAPSHAYLAIYREGSNNAPSDLLGDPQQVKLMGGTIEAQVLHSTTAHTDLPAQTWYWVMAVSDANLVFLQCSGTSTWAWATLPYGSPPAALSPSTTSFTVAQEDGSLSIYLKFAHPQ
jgi:hypothetical protein